MHRIVPCNGLPGKQYSKQAAAGGDPTLTRAQNRNLAWNSIWRGSYVALFMVPKLLLLKLPGTTPVAALGVTFTPPTDNENALAIGSV